MCERQMPLLERMRISREMKLLQCELGECLMQLQLKDNKIQELQNALIKLQEGEIEERIAVEQASQCSGDPEHAPEQKELLRRLSQLLREREEQGVGLHLATLEKEQEIGVLQARLQQAEELAGTLQQQLGIQTAATSDQEAVIEALKSENEALSMQVMRLQAALQEKEGELAAQEQSQQNLRVLQENRVTLQHIIIQNQKLRQRQEEQEERPEQWRLMRGLLQKQVACLLQEKDKMKKIINNYDWKLFCLQTELDLSNKEKKQYKYVNDKHESKITEMQANAKQMTIKIYSLEEEVKAIEEENKFYEVENAHLQQRIDELNAQLEDLRDCPPSETVKQLEYRVREKDEELKEIANYLKEKLTENHECRVRCGGLEKGLAEAQRKVEKAELEAYELEQCIFEHEEIMQRQTEKIDEYTRENEFLNGKINELSLMSMLRTQEFEEKFAALQTTLQEKSAKVNELSVEIIQREIQANKKLEEVENQLSELKTERMHISEQLHEQQAYANELQAQVEGLMKHAEQLQTQATHLQMLAQTKDNEIDKLVCKMNTLEGSVKEKEKITQFLQGELKAARNDFKQARLATRRLQEELEEIREVMNVNQEKIKILKKEAVDNIENELNNEFEMEQLKKQMSRLENDYLALSSNSRQNEKMIQKLKEVVADLQNAGRAGVEEMIKCLNRPEPTEETTSFEVLDDEEAEEEVEVESREERERRELLDKVEEYRQALEDICGRIE